MATSIIDYMDHSRAIFMQQISMRPKCRGTRS